MSTSRRYRRFLDSLYRHERERVERAVSETLEQWPVCNGSCKPLRAGLWEVRIHLPTRIARVIFARGPEGLQVLEGFIKHDELQQRRHIKHALSQLRSGAA